jgi:hypothetical protein
MFEIWSCPAGVGLNLLAFWQALKVIRTGVEVESILISDGEITD